MKKSLIFGGFISMFASATLLSSCSEDELGGVKEDMSVVHLTAVVDGVQEALRAAWQVADSNMLAPDYSKEELFLWDSGDKLVSLAQGQNKVHVQYNIGVSTGYEVTSSRANLDVKLPSNGYAWFFHPSTTIVNVDTTGASQDVSHASVTLSVPKIQNKNNQYKSVYLRTNRLELSDGGVVNTSSVQFNHLTSLLRFHLQNTTDRKYTVKQIKVVSSSSTVFATAATYKLTSQDYDVQSDSNNSSFDNEIIWDNLDYKDDAPLEKYVEGDSPRRDIYDALLVVLPVSGDELKKSSLSFYVTLYDTETKKDYALSPLVLDSSKDNVRDQLALGFPRGKRTHFNMRISKDNTIKLLVSDGLFNGGWPTGSEEIELSTKQ